MNDDEQYHFIGIGGIGMSALAQILLEKKMSVSGSDLKPSSYLEKLSKKGAQIFLGHQENHLPSRGTVIYNSDISPDNPELVAAKKQGFPVLHRSELLAILSRDSKVIAVTGTHGKTTTSALLAYTFMCAGKDPSFAIGGLIDDKNFFPTPVNGRTGSGKEFILEADESDGSFLNYNPFAGIITSIEPEHLNFFGTEENLRKAFHAFSEKISSKEHLFFYGDDPLVANTLNMQGTSYGFSKECQLRITHFSQDKWQQTFSLLFQGKEYNSIKLNSIGKFNALNGAAAFGLLLLLGIEEKHIRQAFLTFPGVFRRCQKKGVVGKNLFLDDYAHHPTEIRLTLEAIADAVYPRRVILIFQPHRFTRTKDLFIEFSRAFEFADHVYLMDIYSAEEPPIPGITTKALIDSIKNHSAISCSYLPSENAFETIYQKVLPEDVVVTMGAGSITAFHDQLLDFFQKQKPKKTKLGLLFGGSSCEHEVSLISAREVDKAIDQNGYDIVYIGIDKEGCWNLEKGVEITEKKDKKSLISSALLEKIDQCDLLFPVLHGPFGEDGTIQGFLELLKKPYVGCDFRSSSLSMDKVLAKKLSQREGVPILPYLHFDWRQWAKNKQTIIETLKRDFFLPLFVKPIHLGSTIGIGKVENWDCLETLIENAFLYDCEIMIEKGLVHLRELEFAILGENKDCLVPDPGELKTMSQIYDYEKKYGPNAIEVDLFPMLNEDQKEEGRTLARKVYSALGCRGMARVDFFLDSEGKYWFNEINPIPGFTKNSMYPKILEREGISFQELINQLVCMALRKTSRIYR